MIRIVARPVLWPSLTAQPNRSGLRLRWDAIREDTGEVLAEATEYPETDGAYALTTRGVPGETLVTMRHEGSPHDSFRPARLSAWAEHGRRRAEKRAAGADRWKRTAADMPEVV